MKKEIKSSDPRIKQLNIQDADQNPTLLIEKDSWPSYEVFHQAKRGKQHVHAGSVHAPTPEMAMVFAKEQYARRLNTSNLWVVKTADIYAFSYEDQDMFETTPGKKHREASGYMVRNKIEAFKKKQKNLK
jgi:ring-1,2-phenylacetyl-CoA epoxidase subunit PaaB